MTGFFPGDNSSVFELEEHLYEFEIPDDFNFRFDSTVTIKLNNLMMIDHDFLVDTNLARNFDSVEEFWAIPKPLNGFKAEMVIGKPKVVMVLNPWPETAPITEVGGKQKLMIPHSRFCGWHYTYLYDNTSIGRTNYDVVFKEFFNGEKFGSGGYGNNSSISLNFSNSDTLWVYAEGVSVKVKETMPSNLLGTCTHYLQLTVRDFSMNRDDMEFVAGPNDNTCAINKGLVEDEIDKITRLPKPSAEAGKCKAEKIQEWFTTQDIEGKSNEKCFDLALKKSILGEWTYDSDNLGFFPIDDLNLYDETSTYMYQDWTGAVKKGPDTPHNFHFCMEGHARFVYKLGQEFFFRGDDDFWLFINDKLVLDVGGLHPPEEGKVKLKDLGLVEGEEYTLDLFFCERQTSGSNLWIETSINFIQSSQLYYDVIDKGDGSLDYELWKIENFKSGICNASKGDSVRVEKEEIEFVLVTDNDKIIMEHGKTHFGGIQIDMEGNTLNLNESNIVGLDPGYYRILFLNSWHVNLFASFEVKEITVNKTMNNNSVQAQISLESIVENQMLSGKILGFKDELAKIQIFDLSGNKVFSQMVPVVNEAFQFSLLDRAQGVYLVQVLEESTGRMAHSKILMGSALTK